MRHLFASSRTRAGRQAGHPIGDMVRVRPFVLRASAWQCALACGDPITYSLAIEHRRLHSGA